MSTTCVIAGALLLISLSPLYAMQDAGLFFMALYRPPQQQAQHPRPQEAESETLPQSRLAPKITPQAPFIPPIKYSKTIPGTDPEPITQ
ncbi:hypothetical protein [Methylicorpusculum sp.]|uniref:hypothetical protein n=1 Tax=Methylicorpusculum sp. TaxID=2713644 RepID=UPI002AB898E3|nr:hypothetical protein [Methylicorpusculum sp.]MDZ4152348.1 hypothetical protein [Methylicorpusculum sp.]